MTIDEQIELANCMAFSDDENRAMYGAILASLEELKRIREVQVPEEPESVRYLRECVVARTRGESTLQYIDTLRDLLKRVTAERDEKIEVIERLNRNYGETIERLMEQTKLKQIAEAKLAAMLKLGENPSEEMILAGHRAGIMMTEEFKAMFAKLIEQAGGEEMTAAIKEQSHD